MTQFFSHTSATAAVSGSSKATASLADRAVAAMLEARHCPSSPPDGNTGGTLRHAAALGPESPVKPGLSATSVALPPESNQEKVAQTAPHPRRRAKRTRAAQTSPEMAAFVKLWFYDWLTLTAPNGQDGTGCRLGTKPGEAGEDREYRLAMIQKGRDEADEAVDRMTLFAVSQSLHQLRVGKGSDGYLGSLHYGATPLEKDRILTVRAGHSANMPGIEIPGGDGRCATLGPAALAALGPMILARADVSFDHSQTGLWDALLAYAVQQSATNRMKPPHIITSETGRTFYWGEGENTVRVYQKDLERVANGQLAAADADPDLVRIEFSFNPHKSAKKSGLAITAKDEGPGALLQTCHWVRRMVEHLGQVTGAVSDKAILGIQRVPRKPESRSCADRAAHGLAQYDSTFCAEQVEAIVEQNFGGDWLAAQIDPENIKSGVLRRVSDWLDKTGAHHHAVAALGVDQARTINDEAARGAVALSEWMVRQHDEVEKAKAALVESARAALMLANAPAAAATPDEVSSEPPADPVWSRVMSKRERMKAFNAAADAAQGE